MDICGAHFIVYQKAEFCLLILCRFFFYKSYFGLCGTHFMYILDTHGRTSQISFYLNETIDLWCSNGQSPHDFGMLFPFWLSLAAYVLYSFLAGLILLRF